MSKDADFCRCGNPSKVIRNCPTMACVGNERSASCGAALLCVAISEERTFICDAIDVGRPAAHQAAMVGTNIPNFFC